MSSSLYFFRCLFFKKEQFSLNVKAQISRRVTRQRILPGVLVSNHSTSPAGTNATFHGDVLTAVHEQNLPLPRGTID